MIDLVEYYRVLHWDIPLGEIVLFDSYLFYESGNNAAEEKLNSFLKARWATKYGK